MVQALKWTNKSVKLNRQSRNKLTSIWSTDFYKGIKQFNGERIIFLFFHVTILDFFLNILRRAGWAICENVKNTHFYPSSHQPQN